MAALQISAIKVVLWVEDMDRALAFYREVIGLDQKMTSPGWSELVRGDTVIALHGGALPGQRTTNLSIQVEDLDSACDAVEQGGGTLIDPPASRPGEPIRLATVADPEGNTLMLTQYVG